MNYPLAQKHVCFVSGGLEHSKTMAGFVQMFLRQKFAEIIVFPHTVESFTKAHGEKEFDIVFAPDSFSNPPTFGSRKVGKFLRM